MPVKRLGVVSQYLLESISFRFFSGGHYALLANLSTACGSRTLHSHRYLRARTKYILGNVREGDKIACCAGKGDWKIIAFGSSTTDYYLSDENVFLKEGFFPDRFDFEAAKLSATQELDMMSVIEDLSFVTNVAHWAVFFRSGVVEISMDDWQLLTSRANASVS